MWPFSIRLNLSGFKKDNNGNLTFDLTEDEKKEVQKVFDMLKSPEGEFIVRKDSTDEIQKGMIANGLFNYAKYQIIQSRNEQNNLKRKELIYKAISSVSKAYSICPLPIYIYDLACFMEMNGQNNESKDAFKAFIELQENFRPSLIQKGLLELEKRDVGESIKYAKEKISNKNFKSDFSI